MRVVELGESRAQETLVSPGVEQGGFEPEGCEVVAVGSGDTLDESVEAQAA